MIKRLSDNFRDKVRGWLYPIRGCAEDNAGISTVELILILVVLIALVLIFKEQLINLVNDIFDTINSSAESV